MCLAASDGLWYWLQRLTTREHLNYNRDLDAERIEKATVVRAARQMSVAYKGRMEDAQQQRTAAAHSLQQAEAQAEALRQQNAVAQAHSSQVQLLCDQRLAACEKAMKVNVCLQCDAWVSAVVGRSGRR